MNALTQFKNYASLSLAAIVLAGCASKRPHTETPTTVSAKPASPANPIDPFEPVNRQIYSFNRGLDTFIFAPVAGIYHKIIPTPVRHCVTNFFSNINDITVVANQLLQFKIPAAIQSSSRFVINSTVGVGGLFDVASPAGLYKQREDFGTTLAFYGMKQSPYLVLPVLGPTTIRDGIGMAVDWYLSPYAYIDDWIMWSVMGVNLINLRSNLLEEVVYVDYVSMDSYTFVRDIYLGRRNALINNTQGSTDWNDGKWDDWEQSWSNEVAPAVQPPY